MYSLLIVDDEPIIADTLGFLINSLTELKLDVFTTYNAYEALELMNKRKIDIVLSDIRMPGMDGITLQKEIYKHWKNCKIIFLTGYNDFSYIQTIIRNGGSVDYILKSEDDEEIIQAVQKAIVKIEEERQKEKILLRSQEKIRVALPIMQKEYFVELIHNQDLVVTKEKLLELEIPLDSTQKLMMVLGKINLTSKNQQETEKYLNKLQKLLINTFDHSIQFVSILYDKRRIILIVQPKLANDWTRSLETVSTIMKSANNYMNHTYNISTSFSYSTKPFSWQDIGDLFYRLNTLIVREVGIGKGVIVQDVDLIDYAEPLQSNVNHLLQLEGYLEMGDRQSFYELLFSLYHQAKKNGSHLLYEYLTALTNIILQYLNKYNLYSTLQIDIDDVIYNTQFIHRSIEKVFNYIHDLSEVIFDKKEQLPTDSHIQIITYLQKYIYQHLNQDLSLTKLSEIVNYSPTYLSKLYKRKTGQSLSGFIAEQRLAYGKDLLINSNNKIHEIATMIGYESPYFIRYFKKVYGVTPQQFREKV